MSPVIDKLQKLLNHERSARAIGNMAEAEAFAGKIAEMLFNHKLSMTEIEFAQEEADEPIAQETIDGLCAPLAGKGEQWIQIDRVVGLLAESVFGYDYTNQAWVKGGKYLACGHSTACSCYGRIHAGQPVAAGADIK